MPDAHAAAVEAMAQAMFDSAYGGSSGMDEMLEAICRDNARIALAALTSSVAVRAALVRVIDAHLTERISWHGPYGATSEEQWAMDTEKQFVRELQDGRLLDAILAALAPGEAD